MKQLSAYVGTLTNPDIKDTTPEQCAAEEIMALREARLNNAELIMWIPRAPTYAEGVSMRNVQTINSIMLNISLSMYIIVNIPEMLRCCSSPRAQ